MAATAFACKTFGIDCIGIVRGEEPKNLSHTLLYCREHGMRLEFISRENYKKKDAEDFQKELQYKYGPHVLIPEGGGYNKKGVEGAALISTFYKTKNFTHICCAAGTATTLAGLIKSSLPTQQVVGFSALKNLIDTDDRVQYLLDKDVSNYYLINDYHFGGYAKHTEELISFMNNFYEQFSIPLDFVYTGKMMFSISDLIQKNYFAAGTNILCIHTGGLQGNYSLSAGTLNF